MKIVAPETLKLLTKERIEEVKRDPYQSKVRHNTSTTIHSSCALTHKPHTTHTRARTQYDPKDLPRHQDEP